MDRGAGLAARIGYAITTRRAGVGPRGWPYREQPKPARGPSHVASAIGASTPSGPLATAVGRTPLSYDPHSAKPGILLGGATVWASTGSSARWRWPRAPA